MLKTYNIKIAENKCWLCEGLCNEIEDLANIILEKLKTYEFATFLIGSHVDDGILERERQLLGTNEETFRQYSIKLYVNRELGKIVRIRTKKEADFEKPEMVIIVDIIFVVKKNLPLNAPVYLFGVGHPMFFSLAVALGCDFFDSAAYATFAKNKRYMTVEGTKRIEELHYLPCSCPVCSSYSIEEIKGSEELLASHNLYVTFKEIRMIKQSIIEGSLWELCEQRCRAHPSLLSALRTTIKYSWLIEKYDPSTKHPFFYLSSLSAHRPEVLWYSYRLNRFKLSGNVLITTHSLSRDINNKIFSHIFFVKPPFGPCPLELMESYPVGQAKMPMEIDKEAKTVALQNTLKLMKINEGKAKFFFSYDNTWKNHPLIEEIKRYAEVEVVLLNNS